MKQLLIVLILGSVMMPLQAQRKPRPQLQPGDEEIQRQAMEELHLANHQHWVLSHHNEIEVLSRDRIYNKVAFLQSVQEAYRLEHERLVRSRALVGQIEECEAKFRRLFKEVKQMLADREPVHELHRSLSSMRIFFPGGPTWEPLAQQNAVKEFKQREIISQYQYEQLQRFLVDD